MLAGHSQVSTAPEPWILLPPLYALRSGGVFSEYNQTMARKAIENFSHRLPGGREDYLGAVRDFGLHMYGKMAGSGTYFVDKTPRYHAVSGDIIEAFPEGKFILLFRNPLAIFASMLETWRAVHLYRYDLYTGLAGLITTLDDWSERLRVLRFEDLVRDPEHEILEICDYLDLDFQSPMLTSIKSREIKRGEYGYPVKLDGTRGEDYADISADPVDKWKAVLGRSPLRKAFASRYLAWIGPARLQQIGYDFHELNAELGSIPVTYQDLGADLLRWFRGLISSAVEPQIWRKKLADLSNNKIILPHQ